MGLVRRGERGTPCPMESWDDEAGWWLPIAWVVGAALTVFPLWTPVHVPFLDWPQHAAMVAVIAEYTNPARGFDLYYVLEPQVSTYLTFYVGSAMLAKLVGVDAALRLMTSVALATTPLATMSLLDSLGRSRWPALLMFVPAWSWPLYQGFTPYVLAVPLAIWTIAALIRLGDRDPGEPLRPRIVEVVVASSLTFLTHALAYGVALAVAGIALAIFHRWQRARRLLVALAALAPSLLLLVYWLVRQWMSSVAEQSGALMATVHGQGDGLYEPHPLARKLPELPTYFNEAFRDDTDASIANYWIYALLFAFLAGAVAHGLRMRRRRASWRVVLASFPVRAVVVAVALVALYFVVPMSAANVYTLSPRMVLLGCAGLTLLVPRLFGRPLFDLLALAPALALAGYVGFVNHEKLGSVDEDARDLQRVLEAAPPRQRLYGLVHSVGAPELSQTVHLHAGAYYMVYRGGLTGFTFVHGPTVPLRLKVLGEGPYPGRRGEWEHDRFRFELYGDYYDLFLSRGGGGHLPARLGAPVGALELVTSEGQWSLWRNTRPRRRLVRSFGETLHHATARITGAQSAACAAWDGHGLACPGGEWMKVAPSEQSFAGRRALCVWAHPPAPGQGLEITYENVSAEGDAIVGYAGVADSGQLAPGEDVRLEVVVDGRSVGVVEVGARAGLQTFDFPLFDFTVAGTSGARRVTFKVSAPDDGARHFCFGASLFADDS